MGDPKSSSSDQSAPVYQALTEGDFLVNDPEFDVSDAGQTIDLAGLLNNDARFTRAVTILNIGSFPVRIGFGKNGTDITYGNDPKTVDPNSSWDLQLNANGVAGCSFASGIETRKVGFRCNTGETTKLYVVFA